ncbi:hypothetical protein F4819DRAFT_467001 [Hypoxylon fuscum]|nr:hypothetical protein F4819DRAFT_467001 [Hypoxylon fuscum]
MADKCEIDKFIIPQQLLNVPCSLSARITELPTELLVGIFKHLKAEDRLCLALSCKRILQSSSMVSIRIPLVAKHRLHPSPICPAMLSLLRRLAPQDALSHSRKKKLSLCCDCLRYRPKRKSYWKKEGKRYPTENPHAGVWEDIVMSWNSEYSFQCPSCCCDGRIAQLSRARTIPNRYFCLT